MEKKHTRAAVLGVTMLMSMGMLTGCSNEFAAAQENLNKVGLDQLQQSSVVREVTNEDFSDFQFLCAEFEVNDDKTYDVDVNGVAQYNDGNDQAYVKMSYNLDEKYFYEIRSDDKIAVINTLAEAMGKEEMKAFDYAALNSIKEINSTVKNIAESPLDDYSFNKGMVFSLGKIRFDEGQDRVYFEMKAHVKYEHSYVTWEPRYNGVTTVTRYEYDDFIHTNDIYLNVDKQEMAEMKADNKLIFDKFVSVVKNNEKDKYVINSNEIDKLKDLDTSLFKSVVMDEDELFL